MTEEEKTETEKSIGTAQAALERLDNLKIILDQMTQPSGDVVKFQKEQQKVLDELREALGEIESGVEEMQERDLEWYIEQNPDQVLDVTIPEETRLTLWRARLIGTCESSSLTVRGLCEMLERD